MEECLFIAYCVTECETVFHTFFGGCNNCKWCQFKITAIILAKISNKPPAFY